MEEEDNNRDKEAYEIIKNLWKGIDTIEMPDCPLTLDFSDDVKEIRAAKKAKKKAEKLERYRDALKKQVLKQATYNWKTISALYEMDTQEIIGLARQLNDPDVQAVIDLYMMGYSGFIKGQRKKKRRSERFVYNGHGDRETYRESLYYQDEPNSSYLIEILCKKLINEVKGLTHETANPLQIAGVIGEKVPICAHTRSD